MGSPILIFYFAAEPFKRGFFCNDESLLHPFKTDTITMLMLISVGVCVPLLLVSKILIFYNDYKSHDFVWNWHFEKTHITVKIKRQND